MISEELFNPAQLFWMYDLCSELWTWKLRSIYNQCHVHLPVQCFSKLVGGFFAFTWSGILVMMIPDQLMFLHGLNGWTAKSEDDSNLHRFTILIPLTPLGVQQLRGWLLALQAWSAWGMSCFSEIKFGWCESLRAENGGVGRHDWG